MALSELAKIPAPAVDKGPSCVVCRALKELPKAEADGLLAALSNPGWTFSAIAKRVDGDADYHPGDPDDPDAPPPGKLAEFAWVRKIAGSTWGRHASGGCSARVRLRPRR